MKNRPDQKFLSIHKNIRENFDFLFERGFHITGAMFMGNNTEDWEVIMMANDLFIRVRCIQGRVDLGFTTLQLFDKIGLLDLEVVLQFIGRENGIFDKSQAKYINEQQEVRRIARLLKKYFDELATQLDDLSLIFDKGWPTSTNGKNGQLSKDNCPFLFSLSS